MAAKKKQDSVGFYCKNQFAEFSMNDIFESRLGKGQNICQLKENFLIYKIILTCLYENVGYFQDNKQKPYCAFILHTFFLHFCGRLVSKTCFCGTIVAKRIN